MLHLQSEPAATPHTAHAARGAVAFTVIEANNLEAFSPGRVAAHDGHGRLAEGKRAF